MLTAKQNMQEVIKGGNPERFVNQYEAIYLLFHPYMMHAGGAAKGELNMLNSWGVTNSWPENVPGGFPVHTADKIVIKDIEHWQDYVHAPPLKFPEEEWAMWKAQYDAVDGTQAYKAPFVAPGLFEQTHHLMSMPYALESYLTNPDEMHDLIKYLTEWELELVRAFVPTLSPMPSSITTTSAVRKARS